jgi:hypothetical protein
MMRETMSGTTTRPDRNGLNAFRPLTDGSLGLGARQQRSPVGWRGVDERCIDEEPDRAA